MGEWFPNADLKFLGKHDAVEGDIFSGCEGSEWQELASHARPTNVCVLTSLRHLYFLLLISVTFQLFGNDLRCEAMETSHHSGIS
jgi:hypothetical protein